MALNFIAGLAILFAESKFRSKRSIADPDSENSNEKRSILLYIIIPVLIESSVSREFKTIVIACVKNGASLEEIFANSKVALSFSL